jgi:glutamate N-acetyltransferase/amino-acid N-acetyltransferase
MSVTAAQGFVAAGLACGIKPTGHPDLALVATADRTAVPAAAVFTTNLVQAAPVQVSRAHLADGRAAAVVLNSGNANAATGGPGRRDALRMCELTAKELGTSPDDVLVCSTGLIGIPMPMTVVEAGIPALAAQLAAGPAAGRAANDGMLTTDTRRKEAVATFAAGGARATVGGMAKGAAMLSPAMATMLAVLTTDAPVTAGALQAALADAVMSSFDRLDIDGSRSTNDTVMILASGAAGMAPITCETRDALASLTNAVSDVCGQLAEAMARDAEGATRFVRVVVRGARSHDDARRAARAVSRSQLVQCSLHGGDPYWGRVLSELGASGAHLDPERVDIAYNGITVCRDGIACAHDDAALAATMQQPDIEIAADLKLGHGAATFLTTDLSPAYIDENMRTS